MNEWYGTMTKVAGGLFMALVIVFTGFNTFGLIYEATGNIPLSIIGLILFEGSLLYWCGAFLFMARGLFQMAIAALTSAGGLFLVSMATAIHIGAVGAQILGPSTAERLIGLALVVNLVAKFFFLVTDPGHTDSIIKRAYEGMLMGKAYKAAYEKVDERSEKLADTMGEVYTRRLIGQIGREQNIDLLPDVTQHTRVSEDVTQPAPEKVTQPKPVPNGSGR